MKKLFILSVTMTLTISVFAQSPQKMSYQCVVRNSSGALVTNHAVGIKNSILQGSATGTVVFSETYSPAPQTNANGLLTVEIGSGTPVTGTFAGINWVSGPYYLKTEIDPAGGTSYTITGTSQLLSVPYALYAKTSTETDPTWSGAANETVDIGRTGNVGIGITSPAALLHTQGTGTGHGNIVFVGQYKDLSPGGPPVTGAGTRLMWYPDKAAFRAGWVFGSQWDADKIGLASTATGVDAIASGMYSTAMGYANIASGSGATAIGAETTALGDASTAMGSNTHATEIYSTAMGFLTNATGNSSTAMGYETTASGGTSTAMGLLTSALGMVSTAMGIGTNASSYASTAIGRSNVGGGNATSWVSTDPLFEIGNGTSGTTTSNAMTVLKNGYVGIGTASPAAGLHIKANTWPGSFIYLEANAGQDAGMRLYEGSTEEWHIYNNTAAGGLHIKNNALATAIFCQQSNSNVGIGTTTPSTKLEVAGQVKITGGTPGAGKVLTSDAGGLASWQVPQSNPWLLNGSNLYYNAGNVGIGTNTPGGYLNLLGNSNAQLPQLLLTENEGDYARLSFKNTVNSTKSWSIVGWQDVTDANSRLNFWYWNGTTGTDVISITGSGNVGIGTSYPIYKLDIAGPLNLNKGLTNAALSCNGSQAIWYDGTYYSWGYGGTYNYFADYVTIGTAAVPGYNLVVNGTAAKTGGGSWSVLSDSRIKILVGKYDRGLNEIVALHPVIFTYKEGNPRQLASDEEQIGFVAQDVKKIFPEAVNECKDGYLDFNMHPVNVALVNAVKELSKQNQEQQKQIDELKQLVKNLMQK